MKKKAFTLMELLVVVVVISLLMALVLPVFGKVRQGAWQTMCANNLRQVGMGMIMFVDDNDLQFPPLTRGGITWKDKLDPYLDDREIFRCPSYIFHTYDDDTHFSYGMNQGLADAYIYDIEEPPRCIMAADGWEPEFDTIAKRQGCSAATEYNSHYYVAKDRISLRHSLGAVIVFVDGHVAYRRNIDTPMDNSAEAQLLWNY